MSGAKGLSPQVQAGRQVPFRRLELAEFAVAITQGDTNAGRHRGLLREAAVNPRGSILQHFLDRDLSTELLFRRGGGEEIVY